MATLDHTLFTFINEIAGRVRFLDWIEIGFAVWGLFVMLLFLVYLWFRRESAEERERDRLAIVNAVWAGALAWVLKYFVSLVYFRPRPFVSAAVHLLISHEADASFPSGHALFAFGVAASILLYDRRFGWPLLGFATLIAVARVYVGVHYPLDVLAGAGLGIAVALFVRRIWFGLDRHIVKILGRLTDRFFQSRLRPS